MEKKTEESPTKIPARRRSGREIEAWIERYRQSGKSARAFASAHGCEWIPCVGGFTAEGVG